MEAETNAGFFMKRILVAVKSYPVLINARPDEE